MQKQSFPLKWMHCASCVAHIERATSKLDGVVSSSVNLATETATIEYDDTKLGFDDFNTAIEKYGYSFEKPYSTKIIESEWSTADDMNMSDSQHSEHTGINQKKWEKLAELAEMKRNIYIVMPFVVLSFLYMILDIWGKALGLFSQMPEWLYEFWHHLFPIMATYVLFVIGKLYIVSLLRFMKTGIANMETLIGLGTSTAFLYSFILTAFEVPLAPYIDTSMHYYDIVIVVIGLIYYGKYLETKSKLQTGESIEKLLSLWAKTALVERDGIEVEISIDAVVIGEIVLIKPGSKIPVDGRILSGSSSIDESMITGESLPTDKKIWDTVIWGTINKQWFLRIEATSLGSEWMLSHIIHMVQEAQGSKAPIQKLADQISAYFVPIVLMLAIVTLIVWFLTGNIATGIMSFITILIIACPCALGLATPTAIIVWVGKWAENGILIKNAESLEKIHKMTTVVFDKTGTITYGKPELVDYIWNDRKTDLSILASLETFSEHPIAEAITRKAKEESIKLHTTKEFENIEWKWLKWTLSWEYWYAWNLKLMEDLNFTYDISIIDRLTKEWKTPILLANKDWVQAIFAVADTVKNEAKSTITALKAMGIQTVMLTGDHAQTAQYIASLVGIDTVYAQILPHEKANIIKKLQSEWAIVGMCGDGINDAPALANADIWIAMGTGTDVAIETADITLLGWDISKLIKAIKLSKQTIRTIKQNLFWAFIYNIIGIPLAAGLFYPILLNPIFAGLAMAASSVSVVTNSLKLKRMKL